MCSLQKHESWDLILILKMSEAVPLLRFCDRKCLPCLNMVTVSRRWGEEQQDLLAGEASSGGEVSATITRGYHANHLPASTSESPAVFVKNDDC